MRLHRFYVSQPLGEDVVIDDVSTIKQWTKVFRYTKGDFVILFNGEGLDVTYSLSTVTSSSCTLIRVKQSPSIVPKRKVTLYLSLIKKDNFELVVQKAIELGVFQITPIISERSEKKNINIDRLKSIVIESLEQCGRGDMAHIQPITHLNRELVEQAENACILHMDGRPIREIFSEALHTPLSIFVGPEGGWSPEELLLFKEKNIQTVSLGQTVLRTETAAIVSCAFATC
jgi:16S rRNA (uracil1498-N3)-methyltransferase